MNDVSNPGTAHPFADGLGERRVIVDERGDRFDVLRLSSALTAVPSFQLALRERANRVAGFHHDAFARVRAIETDGPAGHLLVVSDHTRGVRLATLLAAAEKRSVALDLSAAACLIRQLVHATAEWHEQMPEIVHGAIGPDRIVITPEGRLVLVEHVFGSALEQLQYPRQRFWEELGVALPKTFKPAINARADVLQVGAVALALLAGRRLNGTDRLDDIHCALGERLTPPLHSWLQKALQLDPAGPFASVIDARDALDEALGESNPVAEQDNLLRFMARCLSLDLDVSSFARELAGGEASEAIPGSDDLPEVDLGTRIEALRAFLARRPARTQPEESIDPTPSVSPLLNDWRRYLGIAAATVLAVGVALVLLLVGVFPWSRESTTGAFLIDTRPAGVAVTIDGVARGVTPLAVDLAAGDHLVELITNIEHRRIPVTIRAGSESSQFLEMGGAASATTSELRIRTDPLAASVTVDGRYVGRSPVSVGDLSPGSHTVELKHQVGSVTEQVLIEPGKAASLFVPLAPRPGAATAGWISVAAPVDVQLFENGRFLGSSRIERIMMPAGRHELDVVNEALGYQERRAVQVTAGRTATINLTWPTGRLSINAVPWAQAFVDGAPVGETPIANIQVPIGPHEVLFRHPQLGERRASVTVVAGQTAKVGIDLRAK